ncbi:MAG: hydrogenase maturation protease [Planctomycetaceae bacterium]
MDENERHSCLLVGLGSPHGDDQAGWLVASELQRRLSGQPDLLACRLAKSPSDLLDWLDDVTHLIVCDSCESPTQLGELRLWHWPADRFVRTRSSSSHQLGLPDVLDLAKNLGRLPPRVEIWTIGGSSFSPETEPSPLVKSACQQLALHLWEGLARA